jgi:signal transduction histidine kinase
MGVGIPSMQERVNELGGRLEINSGASGTTIRVRLPSSDG